MGEELDTEALCQLFSSTCTTNTYHGNSWCVWRLWNRTSNSHCAVCKWPCTTR